MNAIILPYTTELFTACPAFPEKSSITRPIVLTYLEYDGKTLPFKFGSIIDSGADTCVFPALFGEKIGIPVRDGKPLDTKGIGSDTYLIFTIETTEIAPSINLATNYMNYGDTSLNSNN